MLNFYLKIGIQDFFLRGSLFSDKIEGPKFFFGGALICDLRYLFIKVGEGNLPEGESLLLLS